MATYHQVMANDARARSKSVADKLSRLGQLMNVGGAMFGPEGIAGRTRYGYGDDRVAATALGAEIAADLASAAVDLLDRGRIHSASHPASTNEGTRVATAGRSRPYAEPARHARRANPAPPARAIARVAEGRAPRVRRLPPDRGTDVADAATLPECRRAIKGCAEPGGSQAPCGSLTTPDSGEEARRGGRPRRDRGSPARRTLARSAGPQSRTPRGPGLRRPRWLR